MGLLQKAVENQKKMLFHDLVASGMYKRTDKMESMTLEQLERDHARMTSSKRHPRKHNPTLKKSC
ncbi:hypothetical protein ACFFGV_11995 [Pontibacillus salicampi]|uniref:Fur-regulated basic protein FbpA n=1 Tax=Pontibacillus salicampi TaxID=1449801 RepID=A0ABV6LPF4_9BACI